MREELSKKVVTLRDERNERLRQIGGEGFARAGRSSTWHCSPTGCSKAKT